MNWKDKFQIGGEMKDSTKGAVKGNIIKYCLHLLEINYLNYVAFYVKIVYNKVE